MNHLKHTVAREVRLAKSLFGTLSRTTLTALKGLIAEHGLSVANGEITTFGNGWYVTHAGLLRLAQRRHCYGIHTRLHPSSDLTSSRWLFKAVVYKSQTCKGFVGYGDADPSNVSPLVHGAELRIAETRAVNRALRKAYGIGICSIEELGAVREPTETVPREERKLPPQPPNGNGFGGPRLRDRLCQVIRQYRLDASLVKVYAIDFCGTKNLRDASREQVENFIAHLASWAETDRNALQCQLNTYLGQKDGAA